MVPVLGHLVECRLDFLWLSNAFHKVNKMKYYAQYTASELAEDDLFIRWVQHPEDDEVAAYWQGLERLQPRLQIRFGDARQLVNRMGQGLTLNSLRNDEMTIVWACIRGTLQDLDGMRPLRPEVRSSIGGWFFARSVAVIISIVLLIGWAVYRQCSPGSSRIITTATQSRRISLPDGSVVNLLPHSCLRYTPQEFFRKSATEGSSTAGLTRAVWLEGSADFEVASARAGGAANSFRVHTDNLTAEATGTRFHVSHEQGETRVLLRDGELDLLVGHRQVRHLLPGESVLVASGELQATK